MQSHNNIKNRNLAEQSYWDDAYSAYQLSDDSEQDDVIKRWMQKVFNPVSEGSCFEVGCFPGRYLTFFGKLGYELNGLDLTPRVEKEFPEWLRSRGYKTGSFVREDFLEWKSTVQYDVVASFGFIEHFTNWEEIFVKHMSMVKSGGHLVIETPNFRGLLQRFIHYFLDHENYKRHFIGAMAPEKWKKLAEQNGFEVLHAGYIGSFEFWVDKEPDQGWRAKVFQRLIRHYHRFKKLPENRKTWSPYCGIIAKKIS
jgi:L-malate glycosyltransferase